VEREEQDLPIYFVQALTKHEPVVVGEEAKGLQELQAEWVEED
jgi:hypothetical protein